jgi:hypothetical protein
MVKNWGREPVRMQYVKNRKLDGGLALLQRAVNLRTLSLLGSATCSVRDFVRTDLRTMLAIALGKAHVSACEGLGG